MGTRLLPLLVVTALTAAVAVLGIAIIKNDSRERLEIEHTGPAPSTVEKVAVEEPALAIEPVSTLQDPDVFERSAPPSRSEPPIEPALPPAVAPDPDKEIIWNLMEEKAQLDKRLAEMEAELRRSKSEIARLKAELDRKAAIMAPFDPTKLPKRKEFEETGKFVDNMPVYKATHDNYWNSLRLETYLHPEILRYRIKWFSGNWSPWFTPGVDDEDSKTNSDGTRRRIWSYFTDHEFQVVR